MSAEGPAPGVPEKDIFPTLTAAQIERLAPLGRERPFEVGDILFEQGGTNRPLMVVLEGEIEILLASKTCLDPLGEIHLSQASGTPSITIRVTSLTSTISPRVYSTLNG